MFTSPSVSKWVQLSLSVFVLLATSRTNGEAPADDRVIKECKPPVAAGVRGKGELLLDASSLDKTSKVWVGAAVNYYQVQSALGFLFVGNKKALASVEIFSAEKQEEKYRVAEAPGLRRLFIDQSLLRGLTSDAIWGAEKGNARELLKAMGALLCLKTQWELNKEGILELDAPTRNALVKLYGEVELWDGQEL